MGKSPGQTQMGLAIADKPQGPYVRYEGNPVIPGNHEVLVWPQGTGVAAMIGTTGPKAITNSILYSEDGYKFTKTKTVKKGPWAGGAYRPEAFTQSGKGELPKWGVEIRRGEGKGKGKLPCIGRFDVEPPASTPTKETSKETSQNAPATDSTTTNPSLVSIQVQVEQEAKLDEPTSVNFSDDLSFMQKHTPIVLLKDGDTAVAIAPAYQGRVMTSTFDVEAGPSFGWINRPVIEKGLLSDEDKKGKLEEHIYIFGGEERFWLGPEGGQFGIFFKPKTDMGTTGQAAGTPKIAPNQKKGDKTEGMQQEDASDTADDQGSAEIKFEFADWTTPAAIDTEAFEIVEQSDASAKFKHSAELVNFTGTKFKVGIERTVKLVSKQDAAKLLKVELPEGVRMVAYETDNQITNTGTEAWTSETGLLSIWMLGMYNPSPETTVVIPFNKGGEKTLGPRVNDSYFGKVPEEYLKVMRQKLFFKGDGTRRGKIGISAKRSKGIAGSYDAAGQVLNIVTYNVQDSPNGFVNSEWKIQDEPFAGDVINSYNDGSPEEGKPPLGPFYELETSSPAAALKPGETLKHVQRTFHIQGTEEELNPLAVKLLGASLEAIKGAF